MKYEIEIIGTNPKDLLELLSKQFRKVSVTPIHETKGKGDVYVYDEKPQEPYLRAQVLCEEWIPENVGESCFAITPENRIILFERDEYKLDFWGGYVFAPTRELAEEIVKIRKGGWDPKEGDRIWFCGNGNPPVDKFLVIPKTYDNQVWGAYDEATHIHIFPSKKQRDAFIEKNKPKEQRPMPKEENIYIGKIPEYGFQKEIKLYVDENGFLKIKQ